MAIRVLFDVFELAPGVGKSMGIYNYARNLFQALIEAGDGQVELVALCNPACAPDFPVEAGRGERVIIGNGVPGRLKRQLWLHGRAAVEARRQRADVYFSPKGFLPRGLKLLAPGMRSVVVVHDLIPFWYSEFHPGYFGRLEERVVNGALAHAVRRADALVAISRATADDIAARLGRRANVAVVHNGVPLAEPGALPVEAPYIFAVTSSFPHKNPAGVLAAYRQYRAQVDEPLPLVVCGIDSGGEPGVISLKGVSDGALHACYANAGLFLFLSWIEGFGFPPVEAMAHGTRVLCSDIPSLREVTRGAAAYVAPDDSETAGRMIAAMLADSPPHDAEQMKAAAAGYSWQACAAGVLSVLCRNAAPA